MLLNFNSATNSIFVKLTKLYQISNLKNIYQKTAKINNLSLEKEVMIQRSNIGVNSSNYKS